MVNQSALFHMIDAQWLYRTSFDTSTNDIRPAWLN